MSQSRLFQMVYLLLDRGTITAAEFASRFEISVRTVYRDVEQLSEAGIPIYMARGRNGGISLLSDFTLDRTALSREERRQILSALQAVRETQSGEGDEALQKLGALFGGEIPDWIEVDFGTWGPRIQEQERFHLLRQAIWETRLVCFDYSGLDGRQSRRTVEPMNLVYRSYTWYLYAFCLSRNAFRFFRLSRMENLTRSEEQFTRRNLPEEPAPSFPKEEIAVCLRFAPQLKSRVLDDFGGCTQEEDGTLLVQRTVPNVPWLLPMLMGYGSSCEVVGPPKLREALKNELNRMADIYHKESG